MDVCCTVLPQWFLLLGKWHTQRASAKQAASRAYCGSWALLTSVLKKATTIYRTRQRHNAANRPESQTDRLHMSQNKLHHVQLLTVSSKKHHESASLTQQHICRTRGCMLPSSGCMLTHSSSTRASARKQSQPLPASVRLLLR